MGVTAGVNEDLHATRDLRGAWALVDNGEGQMGVEEQSLGEGEARATCMEREVP